MQNLDDARVDALVCKHMMHGKRFVPGRLQSALALLERLREHPSLEIEAHKASDGSAGIEGHEPWGDKAHERWELPVIAVTHGRRSSHLQHWGVPLLDLLREAGFDSANSRERATAIDHLQRTIAQRLRELIEQKPLHVKLGSRSVETIIADVLSQADAKGKAGDVAQYLVGAKLKLRFGEDIQIHPANRADRRSDAANRLGDFAIGAAVIEVAVGLPDAKHLDQIAGAVDHGDVEIWILTRSDRVEYWRKAMESFDAASLRRVVVSSVEAFVGQNVTEIARFDDKQKKATLRDLIKCYNADCIDKFGPPWLRIQID